MQNMKYFKVCVPLLFLGSILVLLLWFFVLFSVLLVLTSLHSIAMEMICTGQTGEARTRD